MDPLTTDELWISRHDRAVLNSGVNRYFANDDRLLWAIAHVFIVHNRSFIDCLGNVQALGDLAEDGVIAIHAGRLGKTDIELARRRVFRSTADGADRALFVGEHGRNL